MVINYNVPITFGINGSAKGLNCTSIDFSESRTQSWTSSPVAELDIQLPPARQDIFVQLDAFPFLIPETLSAQQMFLFLGGLFVGYHPFRKQETVAFPLNRTAITGRPTRMTLVLPNATAPSAVALSEDMRELGICLDSLVFTAA
jgi:hypothetical protein